MKSMGKYGMDKYGKPWEHMENGTSLGQVWDKYGTKLILGTYGKIWGNYGNTI